jgi:tetratricopeptide (TPR) repeat protein
VLELASVVGREFWQAAIAAIAPDEIDVADSSVLGALVRKDLIVPERSTITGDDSYRFRHILIRDAAYDALPKAERAALHERFASCLEESFADRLAEVEEIIGYHLQQAHTYRATLGSARADLAERAAAHLGAAGRRSLDVRAAVSLLERARSLSPVASPAARQFGLDIGNVFLRAGEFESARTVLQELETQAEAAHDRVALAHARVGLAQIRVFVDPEGAAASAALEAEAALPVFQRAGDRLGIAKALMLGGEQDRLFCRWARFGQTCERALEQLRIAEDRHSVPWVLDLMSNALMAGPMPIPEALGRMHQILQDAGENRWLQAHVRAQIGFLLAQEGRAREALQAEAEAQAILRDLGVEFHLAWLALYSGWLLLCVGRLDDAEQRLCEADQICERSGERTFRSTLLATLARVLFEQGRVAAANETALHAVETGSSDDFTTLASAHGTLARVLACQADPAAEPTAHRALELAQRTDMLFVQGEQWENLAEVRLAAGRHEEAEAAFDAALDRFERKGATALADRIRARLQHMTANDLTSGTDHQ